jgi:Ni,Fe-hydrogenase III component G
MNKKKIQITNNLWWLDYSILNLNSINFKYFYSNNIFSIKLKNFYYFFLINKFNINSTYFYNLDATILNKIVNKTYVISTQTFFYDLQLLLNINVANNVLSISKIYFGNTWVERELKEFNNVYFIGLIDNRKLLSNYNYNNKLNYNQFNSIVNDLKI